MNLQVYIIISFIADTLPHVSKTWSQVTKLNVTSFSLAVTNGCKMRRSTRTNLLILLLCLSALYLYINTPSLPTATATPKAIPPPAKQRDTTEESVFVNDKLFKDILGDMEEEGERTEAPPKPPEQQETRLLVVQQKAEKSQEDQEGMEDWPSWMYLNPDLEIHKDIAVEGMPDYFDLKSDLLPQFEKHHNETGDIMKERLMNIKQQCERASRYLETTECEQVLVSLRGVECRVVPGLQSC
eukprot:sb/3469072/